MLYVIVLEQQRQRESRSHMDDLRILELDFDHSRHRLLPRFRELSNQVQRLELPQKRMELH